MKTVRTIMKYLWLLLCLASLTVSLYLIVNEGFIRGKAYVFLIVGAVSAIVFFKKKP